MVGVYHRRGLQLLCYPHAGTCIALIGRTSAERCDMIALHVLLCHALKLISLVSSTSSTFGDVRLAVSLLIEPALASVSVAT